MKNSSRTAIGLSLLVLAGVALGLERAAHSSLFLLRTVEFSFVKPPGETLPISQTQLQALAAVPVNRSNLFSLELGPIEQRLLAEPWVSAVRLEKHFPSTLAIAVRFRDPMATLVSAGHRLIYVDPNGKTFGTLNLALQQDLPMISGIKESDTGLLADAVDVLKQWSQFHWKVPAQLSELSHDPDHGFRAVVSYSLSPTRKGRTVVNLGQDVRTELEGQLSRISEVLGYLAQKQIAARQIIADSGKKIVVKIARRS
jgi:cell division septal protein FtsQ